MGCTNSTPVETGLFYTPGRYYDPEVGRFISPDSIEYLDPETINGLNLYAYCGNNPVMRVDPNGNAWWHWLAGALAVIGVALVIGAITVLTAGVGTGTLIGAIAVGAAKGVLIGAAVGTVVGGVIGGAVSGWTAEGILTGMGIGLGAGAIIGAVIGGTVGANGWYNARALEFTNVGKTNEVVWGRSSDGYAQIAKNKGATYFNTSPERCWTKRYGENKSSFLKTAN